MVARTPQKLRKVAMMVALPLNSDLLKETINKVDICMERLQELQYTIAGGTKVVSGVSLSPRSTRAYLKTSLRCKQETLRIKNATNKKSPIRKFPASSPGGDWRNMSLPAMLLGETVNEILQASQVTRDIIDALAPKKSRKSTIIKPVKCCRNQVNLSTRNFLFMIPDSEQYQDRLEKVLKGPISITLIHRLRSHIKEAGKHESEPEEHMLVLNEVTIDRGLSSYLTNLECSFDDSFVTCVQDDGLILFTTSGSTAYSLAAGGSMVHPQVPGILFTPICTHSLSFRPLILPDHVTLKVKVPFDSRSSAWVSFLMGKAGKSLNKAGDTLVCSHVTVGCLHGLQVESTSDFLSSIHDCLHWNLRKTQNSDGPRES